VHHGKKIPRGVVKVFDGYFLGRVREGRRRGKEEGGQGREREKGEGGDETHVKVCCRQHVEGHFSDAARTLGKNNLKRLRIVRKVIRPENFT
jgi:hypothetical protein